MSSVFENTVKSEPIKTVSQTSLIFQNNAKPVTGVKPKYYPGNLFQFFSSLGKKLPLSSLILCHFDYVLLGTVV